MLAIVIGDLGTGKTAIATGLAGDALLAGVPVKSNYEIRWSNCTKFFVSDLIEMDFDRACIVCDEVYTLAESRISSSKLNRFFSYFIFQSRKLGVDVISTAQLASSVDLRLVELANLIIMCERNDEKRRFEYVFVKNGLKPRVSRRWISYDYMAEHVFPYYDTYETVSSMGMGSLVWEMDKFDVGRRNKRVDFVVDAFLSGKFDGVHFKNEKEVLKYVVEDAMFRGLKGDDGVYVDVPMEMSGFVVNRLKRRLRIGS